MTPSAASTVVLDADFGDGARFMTAWAAHAHAQTQVQASGRLRLRLHYLALTPRVPPLAQIADPQLRALWPLDLPGFHRILLDEGRVILDLLVGPMEEVLPQIEARIGQFHLPSSAVPVPPSLARTLAKLAQQGASLHAQAPDEALVWALTAAGFVCHTVADSPDIEAVYRSRAPQPPASRSQAELSGRRAIVIGAGMAGASACHRLCASGWQVTLIERHAEVAQEASGNLAGIFMPLLSKDDNIPTRLSRAAYLFALREWRRLGGIGTAFEGADCGVLQLARDAAHAVVQQEVLASWDYPPQYARWLQADAAGALLGGATPHGGWLFEQGGWARPASLCAALLEACGANLQRVFCAEALELRRVGDEWEVYGGASSAQADQAGSDKGARLLARAPTVILANGTGAVKVAQAAQLPLSALRGQVTHLTVADDADADADANANANANAAIARAPRLPLVVCREAYVTPAANGIVCAGATYDNDADPALRASSQHENLTRLAEIVPGAAVAALVASAPLAGRVGFRCAAPDRLPLAGALPDPAAAGRLERLRDVPRHPGLYGLLGYASRGLIWAPLMAELLLSQLENAPPPLEASLVAALDPGRFLLKQRRRSQ